MTAVAERRTSWIRGTVATAVSSIALASCGNDPNRDAGEDALLSLSLIFWVVVVVILVRRFLERRNEKIRLEAIPRLKDAPDGHPCSAAGCELQALVLGGWCEKHWQHVRLGRPAGWSEMDREQQVRWEAEESEARRRRAEEERAAKEQARLQSERKRAEEDRAVREQASRMASQDDRVDYDDDYAFGLDLVFACRRCGTCYEEHHVYEEKPEWCPFCITEQPDVVFDGLRPSDLADSVGTFMNNFSKEARRAKRFRMARRRGFRTVALHGSPLSVAEAYGNRFGTAWVDGLPMYEDLVRDGH